MTRPARQIRVVFFDVFGTCVAQRGPVTDELQNAAQKALDSSNSSSVSPDVRTRATGMTREQWRELMEEWNRDEGKYVRENIAKHNSVPWGTIDEFRLKSLHRLFAERGLILKPEDPPSSSSSSSSSETTSSLRVGEGSLWDEAQVAHLSLVWHRLPPWPDTCLGLELFNRHVPTVTLSNTSSIILNDLVTYSSIPFTKVWSADMFHSYKPNPKVYLGAAERMGVKPEECGLIATHMYDLKAAKACGFYAIYVERPLEESHPELLPENIPDLWIKPDENGFVTVAERLGWSEKE